MYLIFLINTVLNHQLIPVQLIQWKITTRNEHSFSKVKKLSLPTRKRINIKCEKIILMNSQKIVRMESVRICL